LLCFIRRSMNRYRMGPGPLTRRCYVSGEQDNSRDWVLPGARKTLGTTSRSADWIIVASLLQKTSSVTAPVRLSNLISPNGSGSGHLHWESTALRMAETEIFSVRR